MTKSVKERGRDDKRCHKISREKGLTEPKRPGYTSPIMKISKALAAKFPETTLDAVFIAGTVDAFEHGIGEDAHCVVCGSPIKYCFSTQYGIMGGDCLATLTGDDSTRKVVKSIINQMERSWLTPYKLVIKKANTWKNEYLIFCNGYYEDSGNQYDRFFAGPGSLMAVRCAVSLYAEKHNIKSVEEVSHGS